MKRTTLLASRAHRAGRGVPRSRRRPRQRPSPRSRRSARTATRPQPEPAAGHLRERRVQVAVDPAQDRRAHRNRALRPEDDQGRRRRRRRSPAEALRDIAKGREARIDFVEKDGVKTATLISFKGPIKIAPEKLVELRRRREAGRAGPGEGRLHADRLAAAAARAGRHDPDGDQPALPGLRQVRRPAAEGQEPAASSSSARASPA